MNPEFVRLATRLMENYGGDDSQFKHFFSVACGCKHTLLLNKKGQVYAFGNGLQG